MDELAHERWLERQRKIGDITYRFRRVARKSHFCEKCGCEIPKGDIVWWYKPYPLSGSWFRWKPRCSEHTPTKYNPDNFDEHVSEHSFEDNGFGRY